MTQRITLRIQRSTEGDLVIFKLSGRIQGDQVPALRDLLKSEVAGHILALDLREVKLVDRDAVRFLAQIEAEGAELRNCSAFIQEWILQERKAMRRDEVQKPEDQKEQE